LRTAVGWVEIRKPIKPHDAISVMMDESLATLSAITVHTYIHTYVVLETINMVFLTVNSESLLGMLRARVKSLKATPTDQRRVVSPSIAHQKT